MRIKFNLLILFFIFSCSTTKSVKHHKIDKSEIKSFEVTEKITESISDTLQGEIPFNQITNNPISFDFGSSGTNLNLKFAEGKLKYKAITNINKKIIQRSIIDTNTKNNTKNNLNDNINSSFSIPWWLSGLVFFIVFVLFKIITKFKKIRF